MKVSKVRVVKVDLKTKTLLEVNDVWISTSDESKMSTGETQLFILDKDGVNVMDCFFDVRLSSISKLDVLSFIGYSEIKKERVMIFVWV